MSGWGSVGAAHGLGAFERVVWYLAFCFGVRERERGLLAKNADIVCLSLLLRISTPFPPVSLPLCVVIGIRDISQGENLWLVPKQ